MPHLITQEALKEHIRKGELIKNGNSSNVEGIKYDFCLGKKFLIPHFRAAVDYDDLSPSERKHVQIDPGGLVYVVTQETIALPHNVMLQLSQKRKFADDAISILSGLVVDPGYEGLLVIGLKNHSSEVFPLEPGKKLIAGIFSRLDDGELKGELPYPDKMEEFPEGLRQKMQHHQPVELAQLDDKIQKLSMEIGALKQQIDAEKQRKDDFWKGLEKLQQQGELTQSRIDAIVKGLEEEKNERKAMGKDMYAFQNETSSTLRTYAIVGSITGAIIVGIILFILTK